MKQIATALVKAQMEMGNAVKGTSNPFFKKQYADLNAVREACIPILNKYGIVAIQPNVHIDGKNFVKTILLHESGESIEGLTEILFSKPNDAQAQGSGITYARRYGLQSLVNIGADDDDGNKASGNNQKSQPQVNSKEVLQITEQLKLMTTEAELVNYFNQVKPENAVIKALFTKRKAELNLSNTK